MTNERTIHLVTGGAGFIGSNLVALLRRERPDAIVRVIDSLATGSAQNLAAHADDPNVQFTIGSVADTSVLAPLLVGVDTVFHLAARPSVPVSIERPVEVDLNNVHATVVLLDEVRRAGGVRRVVYAGSSSAYGNRDEPEMREEMQPLPESPYAASKLAGEHYMRSFARSIGIETVTVRFFNVFGPRQSAGSPYSAVIPIFIDRMMDGKAPIVNGTGRQSRDFTFVEDVCRGVLAASEVDSGFAAGHVFNVACGGSISLLQLVEEINGLLGTEIAPEFAPARAGDVDFSRANIDRARKVLGYEPRVSLREGLRQTIAWARERRSAPLTAATPA
jgi:UDP-glucose 4-epimerase